MNLPVQHFMLGDNIDALRDAVRNFADAEIAPRAAEIDRSDRFPMDLWRKTGELGITGPASSCASTRSSATAAMRSAPSTCPS